MIKYIFVSFLLIFNNLCAFEIEAVEDNSNKESFMKNGKLVLNPMSKTIIKPMNTQVLKPLTNKILQPFNPILEKKLAKEKIKNKQIAIAKKQAVKKQFATTVELKPIKKVEKEVIKVDKESTEFFNTLNGSENKPVDME